MKSKVPYKHLIINQMNNYLLIMNILLTRHHLRPTGYSTYRQF